MFSDQLRLPPERVLLNLKTSRLTIMIAKVEKPKIPQIPAGVENPGSALPGSPSAFGVELRSA